MNLPTPEQFAATQKANLETFFGLTSKALEGAVKLAELNHETARANLAEAKTRAQALLKATDPQAFFALQADFAQPATDKAAAYGRAVYEIVSATREEFVRAAEAQFEQQRQAAQSFAENAAKNAPAGSETAVAAFRSAVDAANTAFDTVNKATKQAVEIAQSNLQAAGQAATQAATKAAAQASRAAKQTA